MGWSFLIPLAPIDLRSPIFTHRPYGGFDSDLNAFSLQPIYLELAEGQAQMVGPPGFEPGTYRL